MKPKIIYLIDDDEIYRYMMHKTINGLYKEVEIEDLDNGQIAVELLNRKSDTPSELPDLILLDINMPIMDGWEFIDSFKKIKEKLKKDIKIYMVSSSADENDIHRAQELEELSGYIIKPISHKEIKIVIEDMPNVNWLISSA